MRKALLMGKSVYAVICGWFRESAFSQTWYQSSDLTPKMALWHLSQSENDNLAPHPCLKLEYPISNAISIVSLQNLNYWHENYVYFSYSLDALKKKWVNQTPIIVGTLVGWEQLRCFSSCSELNWVRLSIPVHCTTSKFSKFYIFFLQSKEYHFCVLC